MGRPRVDKDGPPQGRRVTTHDFGGERMAGEIGELTPKRVERFELRGQLPDDLLLAEDLIAEGLGIGRAGRVGRGRGRGAAEQPLQRAKRRHDLETKRLDEARAKRQRPHA